MAKVSLASFNKQMSSARTIAEDLPADALEQFIKNTPKRSGNARRQTRLQSNTIIANYPYSQQLDAGASSQAPNGMVEPTEKWIQQELDRRLKGL